MHKFEKKLPDLKYEFKITMVTTPRLKNDYEPVVPLVINLMFMTAYVQAGEIATKYIGTNRTINYYYYQQRG